MSAAKHTPGPWEADAQDMQQGADDIFTVSIWAPWLDGDRPHIGTVSAFSLLSETRGGTEFVTTDAPSIDKLEEAKANARLIAAAPDLLAALLEADQDFATEGFNEDGPYRKPLRAAIAKATGAAS